ncbi:MAG: DNA topoisomerase VI subunit B [Thermoplasmata archaeon]
MAKQIAEELAKKQKEISVAEFFEKNKHILGFDSPTRAVLTTVKEGLDNAIDACEDANILPDIYIELRKNEKVKDEYVYIIEDNGPGIVKKQISLVFGRLLYGSRFHAIRQSRGQQGIGISAVVMYGQLTTGRPTRIVSKIGKDEPAYQIDLILDTKKNMPEVLREDVILWEKEHGTRVEIPFRGRYIREKKQSVFEYLKATSIVNPHSRITFVESDGTKTIFDRVTDKMPKPAVEIKPHPDGTELGTILKMAKETEATKMTSFLTNEFSRVSLNTAKEICNKANIDESKKPRELGLEEAVNILNAFKEVKIMSPPTDCLSPIGETLIKKGLKKETKCDFIITYTRPPAVYSGNPFQVEAGLMYGGDSPKEESAEILRFANRVPLLYQQGGCAITHAVEQIDWRRYGLEQKGGRGIPTGPVKILAHIASTKVPFTSESKEAVADIPVIVDEVEKAIRECARKMHAHIRKKERLDKLKEKEMLIQKILPQIAEKSAKILNKPVLSVERIVAKIMDSMIITEGIQYDNEKRIHKVALEITNYTNTGKNFDIYAIIPSDAILQNVSPKPGSVENHTIIWNIKKIASLEKRECKFELVGLDKEDYEESELYVKNIDPEIVHGAEPWDPEAYEEKRKLKIEEKAEEEEKEEKLEEETGELEKFCKRNNSD